MDYCGVVCVVAWLLFSQCRDSNLTAFPLCIRSEGVLCRWISSQFVEVNMESSPEEFHQSRMRYANRQHYRCCVTPFVIWFRERSGSSYMCSLLDLHPEILCRAEDFDLLRIDEQAPVPGNAVQFKNRFYRRQIKGFDSMVDDPTSLQAVNHFRKIMSHSRKACGFKFKFDIEAACYPEVVDELHWLNRHLRVILMTRKNVLKQAVSRQNMERIQETENKANLETDKRLQPIQLDVPQALHYASRFKAWNKRFLNSVKRFSHVQTVVYENLHSDTNGEVKKVLEFLGVEASKELVPRLTR